MSMGERYLIIDMGSTKTEIVLYDASLTVLAAPSFPTPRSHHDGYSCIDPKSYIPDILRTIAGLELESASTEPLYVSVTGMGSTILVASRDGSVLYPSIAWYEEAKRLVPSQLPRRWTGKFPLPSYPAYKVPILKEAVGAHVASPAGQRPDVLFLSLPDYVLAALGGYRSWVTDRSFASRSMLFDDAHSQWDTAMLSELDVGGDELPEVVSAGEVIGEPSEEVRRAAGLPAKTLLLAGMHDHIATTYAANAIRRALGAALWINPGGTTESVVELYPVSETLVTEAPTRMLNTEASWRPDVLAVIAYPTLSGAILQFAETFALDWSVSEALFDRAPVAAPPRRRLMTKDKGILPAGDCPDTVEELWKALILSTQYELRSACDELTELGHANGEREGVLLLGGQAKVSRLRTLKSAVMQAPVYTAPAGNIAALGVALLLHESRSGRAADRDAALQRIAAGVRVENADSELRGAAERGYHRYREIVDQVDRAAGRKGAPFDKDKFEEQRDNEGNHEDTGRR